MDELLSVIVPVYKVEAYLDACVASILGQTYRNLELILVDDGSPDNSGAMCDAWARRDQRVRVIHQENQGLSGARNTGIEHCRGRWIAFADSDDVLHPQMLESLYRAIRQTAPAKIACARFEKGQVPSKSWSTTRYRAEKPECLEGTALWNFFYTNELNTQMVVAWNKLYDRELFARMRYPLGRIHEDEFLTYRLLYQAGTVAWVDQPLYFYRQRAGSIMSTESTKAVLDAMDAFVERAAFVYEKLPAFAVKDYEVFTGLMERAEHLCAGDTRALAQLRRQGKAVFRRVYHLLPPDQRRGGCFHYMLPTLYQGYRKLKASRRDSGTACFLQEAEQQAETVDHLAGSGSPEEAEAALTALIAKLWRNRKAELSGGERRLYRQLCRRAADGYGKLSARTGKKSMLVRAAALRTGLGVYGAMMENRHPEALGLPPFDPEQLERFAARLRQAPEGRRFILLQTPTHGNLGDHAIAVAENRFLQHYFPQVPVVELPGFAFSSAAERYKALLDPGRDTILITGGGFAGSLWEAEEYQIQLILHQLHSFRVIMLPQTVYFANDLDAGAKQSVQGYCKADNLLLLAREQDTLDRVQHAMGRVRCQLMPDMVLFLRYSGPQPRRGGVGLCLRHDKEGVLDSQAQTVLAQTVQNAFPTEFLTWTDTVLPQDVSIQERERAVQAKLEEFAGYRLMVTDRLHGMVFAALTGTPCLILDNCDHKVRGVYEWVRQNPYLLYLDAPDQMAQALQDIKPMLNQAHTFDPGRTRQQFDRLARMLE